MSCLELNVRNSFQIIIKLKEFERVFVQNLYLNLNILQGVSILFGSRTVRGLSTGVYSMIFNLSREINVDSLKHFHGGWNKVFVIIIERHDRFEKGKKKREELHQLESWPGNSPIPMREIYIAI